ncbi:MAG: hypothetical protein QM535_20685, partial [Limnohabitans sp.]|nr:hypothetical protein [Limnohabitans sp.]
MNELISPRYLMKLAKSVDTAIWQEYKTHREVRMYIEKWQKFDPYGHCHNFAISVQNASEEIDSFKTLDSMGGETLLKVAIDLGVDTPDFIPSIPVFKNELKSETETAYNTFTKAIKQIETDPSISIGLANSALESIIKEILKDQRLNSKTTGKETLYELAKIILKEFRFTNIELPIEIKTIGSSLLAIAQSIEKLRSENTNFHGKTNEDYLIGCIIFFRTNKFICALDIK